MTNSQYRHAVASGPLPASLNAVTNSQYRHAVASGSTGTSLDAVGLSQYRHAVASGPWASLAAVTNSQYRYAVASGPDAELDRLDLTAVAEHATIRANRSFLILIMWNNTDTPLAYFISFRSYGTCLHGDKRGSIDRFHNQYGTPYIPPNERWHRYNRQRLKAKPLILGARQRSRVEKAVKETCQIRKWSLMAFNVRTNHVHTVVSANCDPEVVLNAFKANATRELREGELWTYPFSPWVRKGSKKRLWNEQSVAKAIDYVLHEQGNELPKFDD